MLEQSSALMILDYYFFALREDIPPPSGNCAALAAALSPSRPSSDSRHAVSEPMRALKADACESPALSSPRSALLGALQVCHFNTNAAEARFEKLQAEEISIFLSIYMPSFDERFERRECAIDFDF